MDIRRFGPGHRRPDGPPGTRGVTGTVIHQDARGLVAELAFERHALIAPHDNPNTALFVVIAGGGYVQVGEERTRVNQGEAVVWPAGVAHGAYTDGTELRAIVIEFAGGDDAWARGVIAALTPGSPEPTAREGLGIGDPADAPGDAADAAAEVKPGAGATPGEGSLARPEPDRESHDRSQGEPW